VTAQARTDYVADSGVVRFPATGPANGTFKKRFSIHIRGDRTPEPNERFEVVFSRPVNAKMGSTRTFGTIRNDDGPVRNR
jgi:hypothetical protein